MKQINGKLTLQQLQRLTIQSQGLQQASPFGKGKKAVLHALEHLGYVQIDTLSIVERAHHHTLWSRIPDYKVEYLYELVKERSIFEYWFHAASYLPIKDFRFALPQMLAVKRNKSHYYNAAPKVMQYIIDTIRAEGPKKARDFESETKSPGSWWNWKPTKVALERLFLRGDLLISERNGMQKTYDIAERVLPHDTDLTEPDPIEFAQYLVKTYLRAYGFTNVKQITHLKTGAPLKKHVHEVLNSMLEDRTIQKFDMEGFPSVFIQNEYIEKAFKKRNAKVDLLSPFDNAIIHRDRISQFFGFDFRLECYTSQDKRQYGYFCLPILFDDTFIGRVDCKAHRNQGRFEIIHVYIEHSHISIERWIEPFAKSIYDFAMFNNCSFVELTRVSPSSLTNQIKEAFTKILI